MPQICSWKIVKMRFFVGKNNSDFERIVGSWKQNIKLKTIT